MGIVFNKRDGVGMRATRPEPVPLPFLLKRAVSSSYHELDEGGDQQFRVKSLKMQMTIILAQKVVRMVCSGTPLQC